MFAGIKSKLEKKRTLWSMETQDRIEQFAAMERSRSMKEMEKKQTQQSILNQEVSKYLQTVNPTFLLKPETHRALLNMFYARAEGTFNINLSMTKEMRKAYSFYHSELKVFIALLERKGFQLEGQEELFLQTFLTKLRENNYRLLSDSYGDFVPDNASVTEAFELYIATVDKDNKYESGHLDFFATYLNHKNIADFTWTKGRMKRKLKHYEKSHKQEFKLKELERRLQKIS
ncbi:hypothetical protein [Alkalicoccus halolimnae]|uniref:Uncharacterized protein n=1 Tax=Alkalicoccus halolimnae TaxID=1667239 RepID=A0A5C7F2W7_9BACI|nr:hypothetical protein [Alkalicoccus halolimnae]TXF81978.1 hypothetical protein FTX54_15270 [Alkalicoccus halolimnae]